MELAEKYRFDFSHARERMVTAQLKDRGIFDPRVLAAMGQVPREEFVDPAFAKFAYEDTALPIAEGQSISQPYIVAHMLQDAAIKPHSRVLEIGAGSGYVAALLSRLAAEVFAVERHASLAEMAQKRFRRLRYRNIALQAGDGSIGWPDAAPFDAILVAAASPAVPESLKSQLVIEGRLVIPTGPEGDQRLLRVTRIGPTHFTEEELGAVTFVPLVGTEGWQARPADIVRRTGR